jgi:hypothetical protein
MNQPNNQTGYGRFRVSSARLFRDNKSLIVAELIIVVLMTVAYLADFIPLSATPFLLLLGWLSLGCAASGGEQLG